MIVFATAYLIFKREETSSRYGGYSGGYLIMSSRQST
jgi:hypothetical protein